MMKWPTTLFLLASCCAFSSQHPSSRPSKWVPADQKKPTKPFVIIVPEFEQNEVEDYDSDDELETAGNSPAASVADKPEVVVEVIKAMEIDLSDLRLEGDGERGEEEEDQSRYFQNLFVSPDSKVPLGDNGHHYREQPLPFIQFREQLIGSASGGDKFPPSSSTSSCKISRGCSPPSDSQFSDDFDLESRTLLSNTLIRDNNKNEIKQKKSGYRAGSTNTRPSFKSTDILKLVPVKKGSPAEDKARYPPRVTETARNVDDKVPRMLNPIFQPNQIPRLNVYAEEVKNIDPVVEGEPEKQLAERIKIKRKPVSHWDFGLKTSSSRPRWSNSHLPQHSLAATDYRKTEPASVDGYYYNQLQHRPEGSYRQEASAPHTGNHLSVYKTRQNYYPARQIYQSHIYNTPQIVYTNQAHQPNVQQVNGNEILLFANHYLTSYEIPTLGQPYQKRPVVWETIYLPRSLVEMYLRANKPATVQNSYRVNENVEGYRTTNTPAPFLTLSSIPKGMTYISPPLRGTNYISVKNFVHN